MVLLTKIFTHAYTHTRSLHAFTCDNYAACAGLTPFDVIPEHHMWIRSGLFDEEMQSILTGWF